jgi:uncharacterized protein YceH (UPF0502 family)
MRIFLEDDRRVDETWLELTLQDLWDVVKRVRRRSGRREERYTLQFDATVVEITVRRLQP